MKAQVNVKKEIQAHGILMIAFYVLLIAGIFIVSGKQPEVSDRELSDHTSSYSLEAEQGVSDFSASSPAITTDRMMNNLYEALVPIEEPSLNLSGISNIQFPDESKDEKYTETAGNMDIISMLAHKNKEVARECAIYWNVKDCLKEEADQPLELESWMTNDAFWNFEAINATNND